ncbi:MAG: hypoxanthine phosphoribosyltransferase, partial [Candidatus Zixiibacteriota bacterium]
GVLKGCIIFLADLVRNINIPIELEFISASSYSNGRVPEDKVTMTGGPDVSLTGRHLIIVEGVVDSGRTISTIIDHLREQEPASIEIVTLLDKPKGRQMEVVIKYKGFDAGEDFVIGFGLDESQKYRNLPFVGKVIEE